MESTIMSATSKAMFHADIRPTRPRRDQWQRHDERRSTSKGPDTGADERSESLSHRTIPPGVDMNQSSPRSSCRAQMNGRQRAFASAVAAALVLCSSSALLPATAASTSPPSIQYGAAVTSFVNPPNFSLNNLQKNSMSILSRKTPTRRTNFATSFPPGKSSRTNDTWSNAVRQKSGLSESRFGVRRRVKSVLNKAKKRTGIENASAQDKDETFTQTGPNILAETASIGGLGTLLLDQDARVDATFDLISKEDENSIEEVISMESVSGVTQVESEQYGATIKSSSSADFVPNSAPIEDKQTPKDNSVLTPSIAPDCSITPSSDISAKEKNSPIKDTASESSLPLEPLPFTLPTLTPDQQKRAMRGERVQFQDDMGRAGSGFVVWDVKAPASVVWDCLLDFQSYPETIPTVREVLMYTNTHLKEDYRAEKPLDFEDGTAAICKHGVPSVTRAQFSLSKFRLKIAAVHKYRPHAEGDYMIFTLDPASRNMVLKYAKGIWHTQSNPDGKEGYTRVWLLCELSVSRLLPQWIVDYAAARAMPRATTWLKPQVEAAATLWLKDSARD